jgi:hypothetical protein
MTNGKNKPAINVYYSKGLDGDRILNNILWGIEEEGIPYKTKQVEEGPVVELGYEAALDSILDVGIGIGISGKVVLHHAKLDKTVPLFTSGVKVPDAALRTLGANAARLVKGIPFKFESGEKNEHCSKEESYESCMDVSSIVEEVLSRILHK